MAWSGNSGRKFTRGCLGSLLGLAALATVAMAPQMAQAQYPEKPITGIAPFGVGGGTDIFARVAAQYMSQVLGQPIVVVNKIGAAGNLGIKHVVEAPADGYTLLLNGPTMPQNPAFFRNLGYDPITSVIPVSQFVDYAQIVGVNSNNLPAKTLREAIELIRKNPGKYNAVSSGPTMLLNLYQFMLQNDLKMEIIPYNSAGEAMASLMKGEADFVISEWSSMSPAILANKIRVLAVTDKERTPVLPDVPTSAEAGFPELLQGGYYGLYVRSGTPPEIVKKLYDAAQKVLDMPEVQERMKALNWRIRKRTTEEFTEIYRRDVALWKDVVKKSKLPLLD